MTRLLFFLETFGHGAWSRAFAEVAPEIDFISYPDWGDGTEDDTYVLAWEPTPGLIARYPNVRAIFSLGAGVDHLLRDPDMPLDVPIIRMSDDGLKEGMAEYVAMTTLALHRQLPTLLDQQSQSQWQRLLSAPAGDLQVGIMGFGALGQQAAQALAPFGYRLAAWSNSPKNDPEGRIQHYAGIDQLDRFLSTSNIVIGLLPDTPATRNLLDARRLALLPKGAGVINAGRGGLVDVEALIDALNSGHLGGAFLDVFPTEPLDKSHRAWTTKHLVITPHVAAITRPLTAARFVRDGIRLLEQGKMPASLLQRERGY